MNFFCKLLEYKIYSSNSISTSAYYPTVYLLIENTYRGTYASIRENVVKEALKDVTQSIKNLLKSAISAEGKAVLQQVLGGIEGYLANPPMQDIELLLSPAENAGVLGALA